MARKKKTFDAVKMVREIREKHHDQFKNKPVKERIAHYRKKAQDFRDREELGQKEEEAP